METKPLIICGTFMGFPNKIGILTAIFMSLSVEMMQIFDHGACSVSQITRNWRWGGVGWGGGNNFLTATSLMLHDATLQTCWSNLEDALDAALLTCWSNLEDALDATLTTCCNHLYCIYLLVCTWGGVAWGGGGVLTSWRPRPWYYVDNNMLKSYMGWGGVGWGGC